MVTTLPCRWHGDRLLVHVDDLAEFVGADPEWEWDWMRSVWPRSLAELDCSWPGEPPHVHRWVYREVAGDWLTALDPEGASPEVGSALAALRSLPTRCGDAEVGGGFVVALTAPDRRASGRGPTW